MDRRAFLRAMGGSAAAMALPRAARADAPARPNIIVILADDMGFSDIGCYGGEIATPNLDALGYGGVRFTHGYSNAKCSPTRASLLTGLYSQQAGVHSPPTAIENCVTIAEVLKTAGYRTLMTGKWHLSQLPVERGFDRYYGMCDGCCNYFNPGPQRAGEPVPAESNYPRKWAVDEVVYQPYAPQDPDFYTTDAFTDRALDFLDQYGHDAAPFFLHLAYTAPHFPLHARPEDIAKYQGSYMIGWEEVRTRRYARQLDMGIIDPRWALSPLDAASWSGVTDKAHWDLRMSVYAAMIDRLDQNIGRVMAKVRALGKEQNTLVLFLSDNGASAEDRNLTPAVEPGPLDSYWTMGKNWANASDTPFRKFKLWDHEGGIAGPWIAYWPAVVSAGRLSDEVTHLIDVMATCVELGGATYPITYGGYDVPPMEGKSLLPVLKGKAREGHDELFWQHGSNRAVRRGAWKLVSSNNGSTWQLYDMAADRTELNDLAASRPQLAAELRDRWEAWGWRCGAAGLGVPNRRVLDLLCRERRRGRASDQAVRDATKRYREQP